MYSPYPTLSKRKERKQQTERRRRERVNETMNEIKYLVYKDDPFTDSDSLRVEKTEILEKAITKITESQKHQMIHQELYYQEGFATCISEIGDFFFKNHIYNASSRAILDALLQKSLYQRQELQMSVCNKNVKDINPKPFQRHFVNAPNVITDISQFEVKDSPLNKKYWRPWM